MSAVDVFTFRARRRRRLVEDRAAARPAPDDGRAAATVAARRASTLERLPSAEDVYLLRGVGAREPDATSACSPSPRCATSRPCATRTGGSSRCPSSSACSARRSRASARVQARRRRARAAAVEPRDALRLAGDRPLSPRSSARSCARLAPHDRRPRHRDGAGPRPAARAATARCASACCASSRPPGDGVVVEIDDPPTRAAAAARRGRAADRRRAPARHCCTRPRSSSCWRRARRRRRRSAGEFVEHDLDERRARSCRSTARPADQHARASSSGLSATVTERYPEGMLRVIAARRPDARARLAGRAGVPADHRRARPRRGARRARSSGSRSRPGAKIAMDCGTENMDWIAAVLRRIVEFTQARRRDQRRRHRHQRRRAAVLERRGDDAHAHARASS